MLARLVTLLFLLLAVPGLAASGADIDWDMLPDDAAQTFEDPFAALAPHALSDLITLVRLRDRLASGDDLAEGARARIAARAGEKEATLAEAGIDPDALLAQRWVVAERRRAAATKGNPALDGAHVSIVGFYIPAPPDSEGHPMGYLVPELGMCSHTPPPPPNQLLRVRLDAEDAGLPLYAAITISGTLHLEETRHSVMVLDGMADMWSSWTLEASQIAPLRR